MANEVDKNALYQAFSHMSRMHTSSATVFFASLFAYLAYVGYFAANIHWGFDFRRVVLLVVPALVPAFLAIRYLSANYALRGISQDIRTCAHEIEGELTLDGRCTHPTLNKYIWDNETGKYWPGWSFLTGDRAVIVWSISFVVLGVLFLWAFTDATKGQSNQVSPNTHARPETVPTEKKTSLDAPATAD